MARPFRRVIIMKKNNMIFATIDEGGFFASIAIECDADAANAYGRGLKKALPNLLGWDIYEENDHFTLYADFGFEKFHEFKQFISKNIDSGIFDAIELQVERMTDCLFCKTIELKDADAAEMAGILAYAISTARRNCVNPCHDSEMNNFDACIKLSGLDDEFIATVECGGVVAFKACVEKLGSVVEFLKSSDALASLVISFEK